MGSRSGAGRQKGIVGLHGTVAGCWWQLHVASRLLQWSRGIWVISSLFQCNYSPLLPSPCPQQSMTQLHVNDGKLNVLVLNDWRCNSPLLFQAPPAVTTPWRTCTTSVIYAIKWSWDLCPSFSYCCVCGCSARRRIFSPPLEAGLEVWLPFSAVKTAASCPAAVYQWCFAFFKLVFPSYVYIFFLFMLWNDWIIEYSACGKAELIDKLTKRTGKSNNMTKCYSCL